MDRTSAAAASALRRLLSFTSSCCSRWSRSRSGSIGEYFTKAGYNGATVTAQSRSWHRPVDLRDHPGLRPMADRRSSSRRFTRSCRACRRCRRRRPAPRSCRPRRVLRTDSPKARRSSVRPRRRTGGQARREILRACACDGDVVFDAHADAAESFGHGRVVGLKVETRLDGEDHALAQTCRSDTLAFAPARNRARRARAYG